jgi:hypothetical protein
MVKRKSPSAGDERSEARTKPTVVTLPPAERRAAYAAKRFLGSSLEDRLRLRIPFDIYFQDPPQTAEQVDDAFDTDCLIPWEPGLADGPTSARFAVVDYDGHTEKMESPARWDADTDSFVGPDGKRLDRHNTNCPQFRQVNVWAIVQRALDFFESGFALGRRVPWAFEGSRLIVVPHAGPAENAYYDRQSKSLQFYYIGLESDRFHTSTSTDIVNHEFGHAMLDGIQPYYMESVVPETAAFHEFIGDLTAILIALRNTNFRRRLLVETKGSLQGESSLSRIAERFGQEVEGKPYLRSAVNPIKMDDVRLDQRPHFMSQVLTATMFDIIIRLSEYYVNNRKRSPAEAFWNTIQRMQGIALQPLDLLPPIDVTFRDYALAVLRSDEIASPTDPDGYRSMMLDVFIEREILADTDRQELLRPRHVFERLALDVFHDVDGIARSRADAYRFLDDNRRNLFIPRTVDAVVSDLCTAQKLTRQARRLPRQVILRYLWREDVVLDDLRFGQFQGQPTSMLCGGTLALNEDGEVLGWTRKPGSQPVGDSVAAVEEERRGVERRAAFLDALAKRIQTGRIAQAIGSEKGLLATTLAPLTSRIVDGTLRFELAPHFGIRDDKDEELGGRPWQISS